MIRSFISRVALFVSASFVIAPLASAHVVVTPQTAVTATRTTFTMSVPNEKDMAVTGLKLQVPAGMQEVQPTVHAGWSINIIKDGDQVSAIEWTGGEIPAGQRDDFTLKGQTPEQTGELQWKAYQTYADGTTVAWDQAPSTAEAEGENSGPYSVTKVSEEPPAEPAATTTQTTSGTSRVALALSVVALVLGIMALQRSRKPAAS